MNRLIYTDLLKWKASPRRKPLIVLGARQVGKTYIIQEFGRKEFKSMAYINCHNNSDAEMLFADGFDIPSILLKIEAITGVHIIPGETLLFMDEIQEIHNGMASLKYFCENAKDLAVVVAGSLLGISLKSNESYPVGKVDTLRMYPMLFEEFLEAMGEDVIVEMIKNQQWEALEGANVKMIGLLRQYYFCGGMPEAVVAFVEKSPLGEVRRIQEEILDAYYRDMAKHSSTMTEKIRLVWKSVGPQLAKENKKFIFGNVRSGARARDFEEAIQWLVDAGLIIKVDSLTHPSLPLTFYSDTKNFKVYLLDIGLLCSLFQIPPSEILLGMNIFSEFKGAFAENYVAQQLQHAFGDRLFYFSSNSLKMEIDFIVATPPVMYPIEVKAGVNVEAKSLAKFYNKYADSVNMKPIRFSLLGPQKQDWMTNLPLYCANLFSQHI